MTLQRDDIPQHIETKVSSRSVSTQTTRLPFKIFECDVCGRILSTNFNLRRHRKIYHTDSWEKTKLQQRYNSLSKNSQRPQHCPQGGVVVEIEDPCCRTHSPCCSAEAYSCPFQVCSSNATYQKQQNERGLPPPPPLPLQQQQQQQQRIVHLHI